MEHSLFLSCLVSPALRTVLDISGIFFEWSPAPLWIPQFAERTHKAQRVIMVVKIYNHGTQSEISKGRKSYVGQSPKEARGKFPRVLPSAVTPESHLIPPARSRDSPCQVGPLRQSTGHLVPGLFTGGWSRGCPLPSRYQNSRLPEESRCSAQTTLFVCLGTTSHSYHRGKDLYQCREMLLVWVPRRQPARKELALQYAFPRLGVSGLPR